MKIHYRHGTSSARWISSGKWDKDEWYTKYGQNRPLCWLGGNSLKTSDDIKKVTCKSCLKMEEKHEHQAG